MSRFAAIDLSQLPQPAALDEFSLSAILTASLADFGARMTAAGVPYDTGALESDPVRALLEANAYREGIVRARVNDAVLATSLAYASGADLDVRAADFKTLRNLGETDASLRLRAQLAWENLSIGGSYGGYAYQALTAGGVDLAGVAVYGMEQAGVAPGEVRVVCLGAGASGIPSGGTLAAVSAALGDRGVRKVNDAINVVAAAPVTYQVEAILYLRPGADPTAVLAAQRAKLGAFTAARRAIGAYVTQDSVAAVVGHDDPGLVYDVAVNQPVARVDGGPFGAPICTGVQLVWAPAT